jgi:UDP-4-amino-4,6-dideoxy-N-acetyl-beta-L-altrosamine transaminase
MSEAPFLPYGRHAVDEEDVAAVAAVLRGDWLTTGPTVAAFEAEFARRVGARHAVAVNSGTAALHLAAMALGLKPGDAAVVPSITFLATANAVRLVGAEVVFADVDPETGLMGPEHLEAALARAEAPVKAAFPVHLAGQCVDGDEIARIARRRGARVVEDACHALGTLDGNQPVGACRTSEMACFSLHPVKTIAAGEGGVVTTQDDALAASLARLRSHGMSRDPAGFENREIAFAADGAANPWYYEMAEPGYNYRISDVNCALALSQLGKLDRFIARRQALAARYDALLARYAPRLKPTGRMPNSVPAWHLYQVLIDFPALRAERAAAMRALAERGVGTQVHYIPVHRQPYYRRRYGEIDLPGADRFYARTLSLPLFPTMRDEDADRVVGALAETLGA